MRLVKATNDVTDDQTVAASPYDFRQDVVDFPLSVGDIFPVIE